MNRRKLLSGTASVALGAFLAPLVSYAHAQDARPFSFDALTEQARTRASQAFAGIEGELPEAIATLDYDAHRAIEFRSERGVWHDRAPFELQPYHPGWLFKEPVAIYQVADGRAARQTFSSADFIYHSPNDSSRFDNVEIPGVAGFKLLNELNMPGKMDELVSFLGASYFRALGRGSVYGLSARGVAVNTATQNGEEFPRFSSFYVETPAPDAERVTIWAELDSQSLTGAYQFVVRPGAVTSMEVTARLFLRQDVERLGIAPLTSMFLFGENNRSAFRDFRSAVHDSDGLKVIRQNGSQFWRSLNNPGRLATSFFAEENPRAFGLYQRDRDFENYQDSEAWYERRPSVLVEPLDPWGKGTIALVEIPTELEVNDNIVAFWVPDGQLSAGQALEFRYRLSWGSIAEDSENLARVAAVRGGDGGVAGVANDDRQQKFVIDFKGGALPSLAPDIVELESVVRVTNGDLVLSTLSHVDANGAWRLVCDVLPTNDRPVEISAYLVLNDEAVSETWLYQWRPVDERR